MNITVSDSRTLRENRTSYITVRNGEQCLHNGDRKLVDVDQGFADSSIGDWREDMQQYWACYKCGELIEKYINPMFISPEDHHEIDYCV